MSKDKPFNDFLPKVRLESSDQPPKPQKPQRQRGQRIGLLYAAYLWLFS